MNFEAYVIRNDANELDERYIRGDEWRQTLRLGELAGCKIPLVGPITDEHGKEIAEKLERLLPDIPDGLSSEHTLPDECSLLAYFSYFKRRCHLGDLIELLRRAPVTVYVAENPPRCDSDGTYHGIEPVYDDDDERWWRPGRS